MLHMLCCGQNKGLSMCKNNPSLKITAKPLAVSVAIDCDCSMVCGRRANLVDSLTNWD